MNLSHDRPLPAALWVRLDTSVARYFAASLVALGADVGGFLILLRLGVPSGLAAATSYAWGIAVHWLISSRAVFAAAARGPARIRQKALFVATALVGLALTTAIVGTGARLGLDPRLAKLAAIGASFTMTWVLRRHVVFGMAAALSPAGRSPDSRLWQRLLPAWRHGDQSGRASAHNTR